MLTYDLSRAEGPIYEYLYRCIKEDIGNGRLEADEKMPSKRMLAKNLGVSIITIENAYDQLMSEGYVYSVPKKGYYVANIAGKARIHRAGSVFLNVDYPKQETTDEFDLSSGKTDPESFPFSIWSKLMRQTMADKQAELMQDSSCGGVRALREAIAEHLASFRGMFVDPDQIVVGAGTEYLYGLLIQLLGNDKVYCVEDPGYNIISKIYQSYGVKYETAGMDEQGIRVEPLSETGAQIVHISPTHHFPTGITMPIKRRYELLAWASEDPNRYIIEDDYDSEFRSNGKPIPPLMTIDMEDRVIYMNTFSKSLASTIRISYMILPVPLANEFYKRLSFYKCTVSNFEQYTLAAFIANGYLEKHINRMRLFYGRKRKQVMQAIECYFAADEYDMIENDSGLHFLLRFHSELSEEEVEKRLKENGIRMRAVKTYYQNKDAAEKHCYIVNYSDMDLSRLDENLKILKHVLFADS